MSSFSATASSGVSAVISPEAVVMIVNRSELARMTGVVVSYPAARSVSYAHRFACD